jgi:GDP-fucose protein O-fucosyltransferase
MRDHMRYVDELQCAAARIVAAMRDRARRKNPANSQGEFDTFHIRRGDFQYKNTRIEADEIYKNVKDVLKEGSTVYIATDERNKAFFEPLTKHYDVYFMDNFMPELKGVNKNMFGMPDCIVACVTLLMVRVPYSQFCSMPCSTRND